MVIAGIDRESIATIPRSNNQDSIRVRSEHGRLVLRPPGKNLVIIPTYVLRV